MGTSLLVEMTLKFDYHEAKRFSISVGIDALLGVRYCSNEYNYSQMKLSEAHGVQNSVRNRLGIELPMTHCPMKPSPRLAGLNTDNPVISIGMQAR